MTQRRMQIIRDSISGLTKPAIKRIGQRAGVKIFSDLIYSEIRGAARIKLENLLKDMVVVVKNRKKTTVSSSEVDFALKDKGVILGLVPPGRKGSKKPQNYNVFIKRVLVQVYPNGGITGETLGQVDRFLMSVTDKIGMTARNLVISDDRKTIQSRDIQAAVRMFFPGELSKHAVSEGTKAITRYDSFTVGQGNTDSNAMRAGLTFAPSRVRNIMLSGAGMGLRMGMGAPIYLAAVLEYIASEILQLASGCAKDYNRVRITNRCLMLAIEGDEELDFLAESMNFIIAFSGVIPHIHKTLVK